MSGSRAEPILVTGAHRTGTTWVGRLLAANPDVAYATDYGTAFYTVDGGKTWAQVYCNDHPDGSSSTSGSASTPGSPPSTTK